MADKSNGEELKPAPVDELIALGSWQVPAASVQRTLREALTNFAGHFREPFQDGASAFEVEPDIESLSPYQLRRFAPDPDRQYQAGMLAEALDRRQGEGRKAAEGTTCIVTPPYAGVVESLALIAEQRQWRVISPPENLLLSEADAEAWWDQQALADGCWVIPELAQFWLRHRSGLALITALFGRLAGLPQVPALIGCSSWCWSFWVRYLPGLGLSPLTLPAMTSGKLETWLATLPGQKPAASLRVRQANNGHWVLAGDADPEVNGFKRSGLLRDLAAMARGNPGVALALWRKSLRARPDESLSEDEQSDELDAAQPGERKCWVIPLDQLTLPQVPVGASRELTGVLHALLLHGCLEESGLALVLSLRETDVRLVLQSLVRHELIECRDECWQVTTLAYPAVRRALLAAGYPVDGF